MSSITTSFRATTRFSLPSWLKGGWGAVGILAILYTLLNIAWTFLHWGGPERVVATSDLFALAPSLIAAVCAWWVAGQPTINPRVRRAWLFLGIGFFMFFLGNVAWAYLEAHLKVDPFPSIADAFYLAFYPFVLTGILLFPAREQGARQRIALSLDLLTIMTAAAMLVSYFVIVPTAAANNDGLLTAIIAPAYPVNSLVLLGGLLVIFYRRASADTQSVLVYLFVGMIIFVAADFGFSYTSLTGTYVGGGWMDLGWNIAQLFFILAALRQLQPGPARYAWPRRLTPSKGKLIKVPYLTVFLSYALVFYVAIIDYSQETEWFFFAGILLSLLIIARQIFAPGFSVGSVTTKLILTFLLVCLFSIGLVSLFAYISLLANLESVWRTDLLATLVVLVLMAAAAPLLAKPFVSPITRLTMVARQIAEGDLTTKARVESQDEIGLLASTFNTMLEAISQTQQELRESEALYRSLVDNSPDIIVVHRQGKCLLVNPAGVKFFGADSPHELIGKPLLEIIPPQDRGFARLGMERTTASMQPTPVISQKMHRMDGTSFDAEFRAVPIKMAGGPAIQFIMRDITERKQAEEQIQQLLTEVEHQKGDLELRVAQRTQQLNALNRRLQDELSRRQQLLLSLKDSEARFRLLFAASPDAILLIDPNDPDSDWPIVDCNAVACTMNGYAREELIGRSIDILNSTPGDPAQREGYLEDIRRKGVLHYEALHRRKNGLVFPVEVSTSLISFEGRELVLGIDREISERKQTELALQQAKEIAEAASHAKSDFLSRMSHELRTPMNAILGFAQLLDLSRKEPLTPTQKERVRQIVKGGQHLLDLINEILDISRIEANRLHISPEPVKVRDSVQEVLDLTMPLAVERRVQVNPTWDAEDENHYVMADRQRLKQVLLNLLSNAVKYNDEGGTVSISCEQASPDGWRISIMDTGPGISKENMGRLFTPFERLGVEEPAIEGTGLGLAVAKRLVELMGGSIGVESTVGKGSTFWIMLPSAESPLVSLQRSGGTGELPALSPASRTILYFEDNVANYELIRQVLADYSQIRLLWAADPKTGLEIARQKSPDLILLDLHLGGRDGAEVLQQLKANPQTASVPVVVVSADATPNQIERLIGLGAHSYLTKPLHVRRFIHLVEELLNERGE
jgi:PAS domain S-box-containing protein